MKRKLILLFAIIALSAFAFPVRADEALYHYGFILSCGEVVYRSFDHELSVTELLQWTKVLEDTVCGDVTPGTGDLQ